MPLIRTVVRAAKRGRLRAALAILILVATIIVFVHFFAVHPDYLRQLRHVSPLVIVAIILLNAVLIGVLAFVSDITLRICGKPIPFRENFLLTAYSTIANFFGPLQSGPGVRAVYLKSKHNVRLRDYSLVSIIQLAMFAVVSAVFLFVGSLAWWAALLIFLGLVGLCFMVIRWYMQRDRSSRREEPSSLHFSPWLVAQLLITTFAMAAIVTTYYFIELRAVDSHITLHQAIVYSGAANFALFVSLTPDAVGIRESFLTFTKRLHHVPTAVMLAANIIDRGAYVIFLLLLFAVALGLHADERFKLRPARQ